MNVIINFKARDCFMSKKAVDCLGWKDMFQSKLTFQVADGSNAISLRKIRNVPIQLAEVTVPFRVIVTNATNYDIILGTQWMEEANAILDIAGGKMSIDPRGKGCIEIPLNMRKGYKVKAPQFEQPEPQPLPVEKEAIEESEDEQKHEDHQTYLITTQEEGELQEEEQDILETTVIHLEQPGKTEEEQDLTNILDQFLEKLQ